MYMAWKYCCCLAIAFAAMRLLVAAPPAVQVPDFNRDIQPLLADNCYSCHGPDEKRRKVELRLDTREGAFRTRDGKTVVVPGQSGKSELYRRISNPDQDERMPPLKSKRNLTARQIELIRQWIDQGATWATHWALTAPTRPTLP